MRIITTILLVNIAFLSNLSCRKSVPSTSFEIMRIEKTGILQWEGRTDHDKRIPIKCYVYPSTSRLDKQYASRIKSRNEEIEHYQRTMESAESYAIWKLARAGLDGLEIDMNWFVGCWPKWPIVIYWDSLGASHDGEFHKTCVICRYEEKQMDIAFVILTPWEDVSPRELLQVVRWLTLELEKMSDSEWASLPKKDYSIVSSDGTWAKELLPKEGSTDFPRQN